MRKRFVMLAAAAAMGFSGQAWATMGAPGPMATPYGRALHSGQDFESRKEMLLSAMLRQRQSLSSRILCVRGAQSDEQIRGCVAGGPRGPSRSRP